MAIVHNYICSGQVNKILSPYSQEERFETEGYLFPWRLNPEDKQIIKIKFRRINATNRAGQVQCLALHLPEVSRLHPDDLDGIELLIYLQTQYIAAQRNQSAPKVRGRLKKVVRVLLDGHESNSAQKRLNTFNKHPLKHRKETRT